MENRKVGPGLGRLGIFAGLVVVAVLAGGCKSDNPGFADLPDLPPTPYAGNSVPQSPPPKSSQVSTQQAPVIVPASVTNNSAGQVDTHSSEIIRIGEFLRITFSDTPTPIPPVEDKVRDDGTITLLYSQKFNVAGKKLGDFEKEIRDRYVTNYFAQMTATVISLERSKRYYVDGEVRVPSEKPYIGPITVTQAIAGAGGFTDFAKKTAVQLIRADGHTEVLNCKKAITNPKLDREVFPGDKIYVPRSFW